MTLNIFAADDIILKVMTRIADFVRKESEIEKLDSA